MSAQSANISSADRLVYAFHDASVPPPVHRSFTVTVTANALLWIVDSYGDEVERFEGPLAEPDFRRLVALIEDGTLRKRTAPVPEEGGCTGGTGQTVRVYAGDAVLFDASAWACGGADTGDLIGEPAVLLAALKALRDR